MKKPTLLETLAALGSLAPQPARFLGMRWSGVVPKSVAMQDNRRRSKYMPHDGKRARERRLVGGFAHARNLAKMMEEI